MTRSLRIVALAGAAHVALVCTPAAWAADTVCPYGQVKWVDFQGPVPAEPPHAAETTAEVSVAPPAFEGDRLPDGTFVVYVTEVETEASFVKRESWVVPGSETAALLQHEQYHSDIAQYWARELEKAVRGLTGAGATQAAAEADLEAKVDAARVKCAQDCKALNDAYDAESEHGEDAKKQSEWCEKIADLLDPPEPQKDTIESENGGVESSADGQDVKGFAPIETFACNGAPFADPALVGGSIDLPTLSVVGYQMNGQQLRLVPPEGGDDTLVVTDALGATALTGRLRLLLGDVPGTTYHGWIEAVHVDQALLPGSPFLQLVQATLAGGHSVLTLQLELRQSLEAATLGFTQPALLPACVVLGSAEDGLQPWSDLGGAAAGTNGVPNLLGVGALVPAQVTKLIVSDARPSGQTFLVVGLDQLNVPLKGGVLVPSPAVIVGPLPLDDEGLLVLSTPWPALPPLFPVYMQAWTPDPAGPAGFSASNGLSATTP